MDPSDIEILAGRYKLARMLHATVELGIADAIRDDGRTPDDIAAIVGASPGAVDRLLWALACERVLRYADGRYFLTDAGQRLRSDAPDSAAPVILGWFGLTGIYRAYEDLAGCIRTGIPGCHNAHGTSLFGYLRDHPTQSDAYVAAMDAAEAFLPFISMHAFTGREYVVDVGGGSGGFLAALLRQWPSMRAALLDQPEVVRSAAATFATHGVGERVEIIGADMFAGVPPADLYIFATVMRCLDDTACTTMLDLCRQSVRPGGGLLLIEPVRPEDPSPGLTNLGLDAWMIYGGSDRTEEQWRDLLAHSGFHLVSANPVERHFWLMYARAA